MLQINNETYLTTKQAAALSGYSGSWIRDLAKAGRIESKWTGTSWAINQSSLMTYVSGNAAVPSGHDLKKSPDGRVYCTRCQLTVTQIKERCKA